MNFSNDILLILLLGMFAESNNINLATNQSFLFLLLLILGLGGNNHNCCSNRNNAVTSSLFPNQFFTSF